MQSADQPAMLSALGLLGITDPNVAFIRDGGNDGTAVIGNPNKPFATPQGAYNAGATMWDFGVGGWGDVTLSDTANIVIRGAGVDKTTLGTIYLAGHGLNLTDSGIQSVMINNITHGIDVAQSSGLTLRAVYVGGNVSTRPAKRATEDPGHSAQGIVVYGPSHISYLEAPGGEGGDNANDEGPSPDGGTGGEVTIHPGNLIGSGCDVSGGQPGTNANSGGPGAQGQGGILTIIQSTVQTAVIGGSVGAPTILGCVIDNAFVANGL